MTAPLIDIRTGLPIPTQEPLRLPAPTAYDVQSDVGAVSLIVRDRNGEEIELWFDVDAAEEFGEQWEAAVRVARDLEDMR